ncbi:MAG: hypothetical protein HFH58_16265 [Lachnospiraceae bacterium]|jgi:hypothetical protein|nr:hypothetical protein [Lachnospiraceae bacterium]
MSVGGISGSFPYYPSGKVQNSILESVGCKSVYEADPSAVIRKEEDGIVAKSHYTEDEALWNQYMKQYRDSLKIVDGKLEVNGDPRNVLLGKVSREELEQYRLKLEREGIGDEIDWRGVESDFKKMDVNFDNAGYLSTKIDYISSRYAVLKDRIEKHYSGDEKEQQLSKLNEIMDSAKKTIIDSYSDSVGNFYEKYGHSGAKAELAESLQKGIDQRVSQYTDHLQKSESYAGLGDTTAKWLQQDDGYMAARLREDMAAHGGTSAQAEETGYTLEDLETAGVYAAECKERLDNQGVFWSDNEERLGVDLAVQGMKTDYLARHGNLSGNMQNLLQDTFQNYKNKYVDLLEQTLKEKARGFNTPMKTNINRENVAAVYEYTMNQYRQSGDILDAFTKGARHARSMFETNFSDRAGSPGSYSAKYDWDHFFEQSNYTSVPKTDSLYEKYRSSINRFLGNMKSDSHEITRLFFNGPGDYELNRFA